ncbi:MAG: ABC transporter substrate-binding protein [Parvularculaceae bacterium]|nr:ABC transporter substrate-binding protein [Parvularculaceae bacterium]
MTKGLDVMTKNHLALVAILLASTLPPAMAAPAAAPATATAPALSQTEEASRFAKQMLSDATAALTKQGATEAQKIAAFQEVLKKSLALDVVGRFMLGSTRDKMTAAQLARYDAVFPQYITRQYAQQFKDLVGRPMEVTEARALNTRDSIVRAKIKRKDGASINIDWRVRKLKDGSLKMIDIIVSGVSIMLVKREEFAAFIAKNGVDPLLARLEKEAKGA